MALTNIPENFLCGRSVLRTDLPPNASAEQLKDDLQRVLPQHAHNLAQIRFLQEYLRGWHPFIQEREKQTRTDVDNKITVNYAYSISRDIVGYFLGKPIQYTQRQGKWRKQMENFNASLSAENKALVDYQIAEDCSICGVGYRGIFNDAEARNGTHLKLLRLDPKDTFVVYSSDPTKPPVYAVTSYETADNNMAKTYYKVYTPTKLYVFADETRNGADPVTGANLTLTGTPSTILVGGTLPIIEYQNNLWRLGDWEMAVSVMNAIDAVTSDGVNDIQQAVNAVLVAMGVEMTQEDFNNLSVNGFLNVANIPVGTKPVVEFISQAMDAAVGVSMREYLEATLRVIVGVPDRKTRGGGGGDTGDAVFLRDGWQDIDLVAAAKEPYFIQSEREALNAMLYLLDTHGEVSNLTATDIEIHFNRNKTANLQSKAQVWQILRGTPDYPGLAPEDALDIAGLTNSVHDVIMRMNTFADSMRKERIEQQDVSGNGDPNPTPGGGTPSQGTNGDTDE